MLQFAFVNKQNGGCNSFQSAKPGQVQQALLQSSAAAGLCTVCAENQQLAGSGLVSKQSENRV